MLLFFNRRGQCLNSQPTTALRAAGLIAEINCSRKLNLAVYSQMFCGWWLRRNAIRNIAVNFMRGK